MPKNFMTSWLRTSHKTISKLWFNLTAIRVGACSSYWTVLKMRNKRSYNNWVCRRLTSSDHNLLITILKATTRKTPSIECQVKTTCNSMQIKSPLMIVLGSLIDLKNFHGKTNGTVVNAKHISRLSRKLRFSRRPQFWS